MAPHYDVISNRIHTVRGFLISVCFLSVSVLIPMNVVQAQSWVSKIRSDHPRLFINGDTWPQVKSRAFHEERSYYDSMKARVDGYPLRPRRGEWGSQAMEAAFLYLVTDDSTYLMKTKDLLERSIQHYEYMKSNNAEAAWHCFNHIHTITAYDMLFDHLSRSERADLGNRLINHIKWEHTVKQKSRTLCPKSTISTAIPIRACPRLRHG